MATDADGDGLPDSWEEQIVAARADDELWSVADVLTDDDFDGRLIPGSRRVPLDRVVRTAREERLAADAELVVYCSGPGCPQSGFAAEKLAGAGYRAVRLFDGGLLAWAEAGLPFENRGLAS